MLALVEIDKGPYLVLPTAEAFDSGERPLYVDASNIVWADPLGMPASANGPKVAYLWGKLNDGRSNGSFVKLPVRFNGKIHSHGSTFRAVVVKGQPQYLGDDVKTLEPGSYFGSKGETAHQIAFEEGSESVIYVRTDGRYEVASAK